MTAKRTWFWVCVAAGLFAFIFFYQRHTHKPPTGPGRILPNLQASAVTSVQVRPEGQLEIRAQRTNGVWTLTKPLAYSAQATSVENLLKALQDLTPGAYITRRELRERPDAEEEYGFGSPQASLIIQQPDYTAHIQFGIRTAPGDQVFMQIVGDDGVYVVDAELLKYVPRQVNDWRDTTVIDLKRLAFDHITVASGSKTFQLLREGTNVQWRLGPPIQARADSPRISEALLNLEALRVQQFIPEEPKPDIDALGLQNPDLQVTLADGTNNVSVLQFGKSPTNDAKLVYCRRFGQNAVFTVQREHTEAWRVAANDFRDPHLLVLNDPVAIIDVRGQDDFSLVLSTNNTWRLMPLNVPADAGLVVDLLASLVKMRIVQFVKDVVPEPDLPTYGLATPTVQYTLRTGVSSSTATPTNNVLVELKFGTNQDDKIYVRRGDESSVYAVKMADCQALGTGSWQYRNRQIWDLKENELAGITVRQKGKVRQSIRKAQYEWALAPGSQGVIEPLSTEETVRGLCHLSATAWVARGETNRVRYGFTNTNHQVTLELKNGEKKTVEFGIDSPSTFPYAGVTLDGEFWIFEFPLLLCRDVLSYLSIRP